MYRPEAVHYDATLDALDGVDNHSYGASTKLLERFLRLDVHHGKPATKPWMRVVPTYTSLGTTHLLKVLEHFLLIDWVD